MEVLGASFIIDSRDLADWDDVGCEAQIVFNAEAPAEYELLRQF